MPAMKPIRSALQVHGALPVVHQVGTHLWIDVPLSSDRDASASVFLTMEATRSLITALALALLNAERVQQAERVSQAIADVLDRGETHYVPRLTSDGPNGTQEAICGHFVTPEAHSVEPSCAECSKVLLS